MISKEKQTWYLQTWFIALLFSISFLGFVFPLLLIFPVAGIVLTVLQYRENKKLLEQYGEQDRVAAAVASLNDEYTMKKADYQQKHDSECKELDQQYNQLEENRKKKLADLDAECENVEKRNAKKIQSLKSEIQALNTELKTLISESVVCHYSFSDYDGLSSEECKNKLSILKTEEQALIRSNDAFIVSSDGSKKEINDNKKQILRCFNAECDNFLLALSCKNVDSIRNKVSRSFESLNKIFSVDGIALDNKLLEYKLEELNLVYTYELKKEQEREQQKAIKEQMIEEEKVRREIERQKAKIEKDQTQCNNEVKKLLGYMQKTSSDVEKQLYIDKIKELEEKLKELESAKESVLEREANARAGYVYIISNIGSFGDDIYKIGMTRRLEPMDRIKELSSASVPFEFDVHAMIFSDNAPELENILHKHFEAQSVNRVNLKKEFFHVSLDEIEKVVKENYNNTVEFTRIPVANEYRQTQAILQAEAAN